MTIQNTSLRRIDRRTWLLSFTSTAGPPITVWVDGRRRDTFLTAPSDGTYSVRIYGSQQHIIDVVEGTNAPAGVYPARVTLGWYRVDGAHSYRIDEYDQDATEWVERDRLPDTYARRGRYTWWYSWESRRLEDGTEHQFRVVPEGELQTPGAVSSLQALVVRHPDPPAVEYSYDADTQKLTVSERT